MIQTCALIDQNTGNVTNMVVADPDVDPAPAGEWLVAVPDGMMVDQRWVWSQGGGFVPGPELQAELDAQAAADAQAGS